MISLLGCSKLTTYQATYSTISMAKINPADSLKLEDWISVDTNNIYSNGRLVVVEKMQCYTNGKLAYFDNQFVKSSQGTAADDGSLRHIFLDYEKGIIYFLDDKLAFQCDFAGDVVFTDVFNSRVFARILKKDNSEVRITFDKEVPKEIRGKYINTKNEYGITQTLSVTQKMNLIDYRISRECSLDSIAKIARKQCVLNSSTKIDLLFPKMN
ncbi:hypothetical protein D3C87_278250 [compost metagenome]